MMNHIDFSLITNKAVLVRSQDGTFVAYGVFKHREGKCNVNGSSFQKKKVVSIEPTVASFHRVIIKT